MASTQVRVSGTWHSVQTVWVRSGGVWRQVRSVWTNVSGTWRKTYEVFQPSQTRVDGGDTPLESTISGSITVPQFANSAVVTLVGHGAASSYNSKGGGGGGRAVYSISLLPADWGKSINYVLATRSNYLNKPPLNPSTASCSFANGSMSLTSNGGASAYTDGIGSGGTASGGNVSNTTGGAGNSTTGGASGNGDPGGAASSDGFYGAGAGASTVFGESHTGGAAYITVDWS